MNPEQVIAEGKEYYTQQGLEQGIKQGRQQGIEASVVRMIKSGSLSPEQISSIMAIDIERVREMKNRAKA